MKQIFLETNAYSNYFRGHKEIKKVVLESDRVLISVITLGELYLGFKEGGKEGKNLSSLGQFVSDFRVRIVEVGADTSWQYGKIKYELRRKGTPIPDNDIWIAAQVVETGATLVTYDRHFLKIPNLKMWKELK